MTQKKLITTYIIEHGKMIPAKMAGDIYMGQMFGSETSKRCRELRRDGELISYKLGKFEVYELASVQPKQTYNIVGSREEKTLEI